MENQSEIKLRFTQAVNSFIEKIKTDKNVIAVILCGSLSYDNVWEKSDVDLQVIIRDQTLETYSYCLDEDDVVINVNLMQRSKFKRSMERIFGGNDLHSFYSLGQIIYTTDDSLYEYYEDFKKVGKDDSDFQLFFYACEAIAIWEKCEKWLVVKKDLIYSQYYLLKTAECIAKMEIIRNGESPNREAVQRAMQLNPELMDNLYTKPMTTQFDEEQLRSAIKYLDDYFYKLMPDFSKPILDYLQDGEIKTMTMISRYFRTSGHFIAHVLEYLCEKDLIVKVTETIRITPNSRKNVEEIAYILIKN